MEKDFNYLNSYKSLIALKRTPVIRWDDGRACVECITFLSDREERAGRPRSCRRISETRTEEFKVACMQESAKSEVFYAFLCATWPLSSQLNVTAWTAVFSVLPKIR